MLTPDLAPLVRLDRLGPALAAATGDDRWTSVDAELIRGGKSNLTFTLRSAAGELILRRPPTGPLLPRAHDMAREALVQRRLRGTGVPVPEIVLVDGGGLVGVPLYVMKKIEGHIVRDVLPEGFAATATDRRRLAWGLVDTLAALHAVDFEGIGLADYGRPDGFLERQVRLWERQWEAAVQVGVPEMDALAGRLAASVPAQRRSTIVHGDYRTDNVVLHPRRPGQVEAVLDWELSTLGDPLADLALLTVYWPEAGEPGLELVPAVSHLPGFPTRGELVERYARSDPPGLDDFGWHRAFAHFKLGAIIQGVAARSRAGAMADQDFGDAHDQVRRLSATGLRLLGG